MTPETPGPVLDVSGPDVERRIPLGQLQVLDIGRGHSNFLCLINSSVSRNHALIRRRPDGNYTVMDVGSRNGTEVNGQRIQGVVALQDGDKIKIGEYTILYTTPSGPAVQRDTQSDATRLVVSHKPVTVLVMDLYDYTGLSRRLPNSDLTWLLAQLGEQASTIFSQRMAWNFKTIADAVMAVWVHDSLDLAKDQIKRPLGAALAFAEAVQGIGKHLGEPLRTGAGVTTGEAAIGGLGAMGRVDVIGDSVNLAFRLEAATRPAGVDMLVCDQTRQLLDLAPPGLFRTEVTNLKGFDEPVSAHSVTFEALGLWLNG